MRLIQILFVLKALLVLHIIQVFILLESRKYLFSYLLSRFTSKKQNI